MSVYVYTTVKDYKAAKKALDKMKKAPATAVQRSLSDVRKRAPGWVASEIVNVYGVSKSEITGGKIGTTKVSGISIDKITIKYRGRRLTPVHFHMSPAAPKSGAYTLKSTIIKGNRATLGKVKKLTKKQKKNIGRNFHHEGTRNSPQSPWMLQTTGAKSADGVPYIPFQRRKQPGKPQYAMRTLSLPQMVSGERTNKNITEALQTNLDKRVSNHMKQLWK
mgnify:CR=1 FL=1